MFGVWVWHIIAGILGIIFSLSIVYQRMEHVFSVYQKIKRENLVKVITESGQELEASAWDAIIQEYNSMIFMGKLSNRTVEDRDGISFHLRSGEQIHMAMGEKFYVVRRVTKRGKTYTFGLLNRQPASSPITSALNNSRTVEP